MASDFAKVCCYCARYRGRVVNKFTVMYRTSTASRRSWGSARDPSGIWGPMGNNTKSEKKKNVLQSTFKKNIFINTFFLRFLYVLAPQKEPQIEFFSLFFLKTPILLNCFFPQGISLFFRFQASQKRFKIDAKTHSKKEWQQI